MPRKKYQAVLYDGNSREIARFVGRDTQKDAEADIDDAAERYRFDHAKIDEVYYPSKKEAKEGE